jgi:hypothetical protein
MLRSPWRRESRCRRYSPSSKRLGTDLFAWLYQRKICLQDILDEENGAFYNLTKKIMSIRKRVLLERPPGKLDRGDHSSNGMKLVSGFP